MKNYFLKIISIIWLAFFILGCGTESSGSSVESLLSIETQKSILNEAKDELGIDFSVKSTYSSNVGVTLSDLALSITPCKVEQVIFSPSEIVFDENTEEKDVHTVVKFKEACTPTSYLLKGTSKLSLDGKTNEVAFGSDVQEVSLDENGTTSGGASNDVNETIEYKFKNITSLIVKHASKEQILSIDLINTSDVGVSGKTIQITTLDNKFGSFSSSTAQTDEAGRATFVYTSPQNIDLIIGKSTNPTITFSEDGVSITQRVTIGFQKSTDTNGSVDTNNSVDTNGSVDTINYGIKFSLENQEVMKFNLEDKKSFKVALINKDTGNSITDSKIDKITVISKQPKLLKLFDADTNTIASGKLVYENKNDNTIYVQTYTNSGLADIDIKIEYHNSKGNVESIQKTYSTMVLSGPPTAFSINSAGISYNFETKWFENKFLISAVDRYNNIVNISPTIYVSAMTGFTRDSRGKEVLYGNFGNVEGKLNVDKESKVATFEANSTVFDNIDVNRDYLYVFGQVDDYEALGKWDIDSYESSHTDTTLALSEAFNGKSHDKLGFVLGHNYLIDPGSSASAEWQVKIDSTDGKYQLDSEGKAFITLKYPTYLIGKRTALAINFLGKTPETGKILRSGEVTFRTLHSFQGVVTPDLISVDKNTTKHVRVYFDIDTGTADIPPVLNSHVSCKTKVTNIIDSHIYENTIVSTVEEFKLYGEYKAYWDLVLKASENKAGSFTFEECQVRGLPRF